MAPHVWRLPLRGVNAYAIETDQGIVLVDAGNPGDGPRILSMLHGVGLAPPRLILLTHADVDHAGGVRALLRICAPEVRTTEGETSILAGGGHPRLFRRLGRLLTGRIRCAAPVAIGDRTAGLLVVATPGHTAGHCSFLREADGVLFAGDAAVVRSGEVGIPARLFTDDLAQAEASLAHLADLGPRLLLPGHGAPLPEAASGLRKAVNATRSASASGG